ncbi:MAG: type II toxin-antitoxin system RelE/ParE family toxin [Candidatus Absconditabacterales bacterium]|nr:type II toxin-antitoxin system RelE/ParE family toxin [Candidatus Absconditabacterales bacterium]
MLKVEYTKESIRQLKKFPSNIQKKIIKKIELLSQSENIHENKNVRRLTGDLKEFHRLRVGDLRIIIKIRDGVLIIIFTILPRG